MKFKFAGLAQIFAITCILCLSHCELGPAQTSELNIKYLRGAETAEGPFCGIYCVYAAAAILHKPIPIQDLLINKYVNSSEGSSLHDLLLAAEDHGLEALPVENITTSILSNSQYPIILHVRQGANDSKFNHFVLVVNAEDGIARVLDPDAPSKYTPLHELASRMDGYGLVVASERIDEKKLFAPQRIKFLLIGLGGVFFGLAAWYFASKSPVVVHPFGDLSFRGGRAIKQFASLLGFSAVVGLSWTI
jgi:ABC-type bacteriocin/lantibiotic exporter with double-glycine peptidase domain